MLLNLSISFEKKFSTPYTQLSPYFNYFFIPKKCARTSQNIKSTAKTEHFLSFDLIWYRTRFNILWPVQTLDKNMESRFSIQFHVFFIARHFPLLFLHFLFYSPSKKLLLFHFFPCLYRHRTIDHHKWMHGKTKTKKKRIVTAKAKYERKCT